MNGIIINIDPIAFSIGGLELRWYGIFIMLAIIAAGFITHLEAKRRSLNLDVNTLLLVVVLAGMLGARLFHVVDNWSFYAAQPQMIWHLSEGGLAIWGGLLGGGIAVLGYALLQRLPLLKLLDVLVPGVIVGLIIGRLACIVNGDTVGGVTNLPWAFIYTNPGSMIRPELLGLPVQPYPLYEMLWNGLGLALILWLRRRPLSDGILFLTFIGFYAAGRFLLTFVRIENEFIFGLQQAQLISLVMIAFAATAALLKWRPWRTARSQPAEIRS
ncbi:prolipoprotein diacylglyceryl transferase [Dehalogenimonas sp. 4OHTPN]|uniref:Phosphatidylglycerol--prolipoprotein diacylglyceryl transferase n=1 Tax=Dehalogenimonas sp. 4OHTPN TaxID=3166643 RepID=A0AAU8GBB7_9CHLR